MPLVFLCFGQLTAWETYEAVFAAIDCKKDDVGSAEKETEKVLHGGGGEM